MGRPARSFRKCSGLNCTLLVNRPEEVIHTVGGIPKSVKEIGRGLGSMALNVGSLFYDKEVLEDFLNEGGSHVAIIAESNITPRRLPQAFQHHVNQSKLEGRSAE